MDKNTILISIEGIAQAVGIKILSVEEHSTGIRLMTNIALLHFDTWEQAESFFTGIHFAGWHKLKYKR